MKLYPSGNCRRIKYCALNSNGPGRELCRPYAVRNEHEKSCENAKSIAYVIAARDENDTHTVRRGGGKASRNMNYLYRRQSRFALVKDPSFFIPRTETKVTTNSSVCCETDFMRTSITWVVQYQVWACPKLNGFNVGYYASFRNFPYDPTNVSQAVYLQETCFVHIHYVTEIPHVCPRTVLRLLRVEVQVFNILPPYNRHHNEGY